MGRNINVETKGQPWKEVEGRAIEAPIGRGIRLSVRLQRQTPHQERRLDAAIDALLSELVRREIGRRGETHDTQGS
jgi:hypothetical protein